MVTYSLATVESNLRFEAVGSLALHRCDYSQLGNVGVAASVGDGGEGQICAANGAVLVC